MAEAGVSPALCRNCKTTIQCRIGTLFSHPYQVETSSSQGAKPQPCSQPLLGPRRQRSPLSCF